MELKFLSYYINNDTPLYGGKKDININTHAKMANGQSSNSHMIHMPNHTGTHIDFPYHFSQEGKKINDYNDSFWKFMNVQVIDVNANENQIIDDNLIDDNILFIETEFLIIKTGFHRFRDSKIYWNNNPGLAPELASFFKQKCPNLRVVGFDFISLSSYQNRELGRQAHHEFLVEEDILVIEDMDLENIGARTKIKSIIALPLLLDRIDGVPITILAEIYT